MASRKPNSIVPNLALTQNVAKDVWSLTNEAAAVASSNAQNKGREPVSYTHLDVYKRQRIP